MFQEGVNANDDLDEYFNKFERLGLIYISRNKRPIIIRQNSFTENIGTFGGAITINSPDWKSYSTKDSELGPFIVISDNSFTKNLAYLSGGAIYIHNNILQKDINLFCGGIHLGNNLFINNTGMKIHNGGAVAMSCNQIQEEGYEDYLHTSSLPFTDASGSMTSTVKSQLDNDVSFKILTSSVTVSGSNFTENYSGQKGTALYLRQFHRVYIFNSTFLRNGPVFALTNLAISPYSRYFTAQQYSVTFRDPVGGCSHEFNYLDKCQTNGMTLDWPQIKGAVYVQHCNDAVCMSKSNTQSLLIDRCVFESNSAGPLVDSTIPYDLAQSLYISNGFNNDIRNTQFRDHSYNRQLNITNVSSRLQSFFPKNYFNYGQAAVIRIMTKPVYLTGSDIYDYVTTLKNVSFLRNYHAQILGQNFMSQYYGSLISYETGYMFGMPYAPQMKLDNCTFRENQFLGNETSLIFMFKGLLTVQNTIAYGNGYLSKSSTIKARPQSTSYFQFQSYKFLQYQMYGLFYLMGLEQFPASYVHSFTNNTFRFNFAYEGAVYSFKIDNQYALMQNNTYKFHVVNKQGGAAYVRSQDGRTTLMFVNESMEFMYAKSQGAISAEPHDPNYVSLYIVNSTFKNNNAQEGQSIFTDSCATVTVIDCTFSNDLWQQNYTAFMESQFQSRSLKLQQFVEYKYLYSIVDQITPEGGGAIYIEQNFNDKPVYFDQTVLIAKADPYLRYSQFIDCSFQNLRAVSGAAIMAGKMSYVRIVNTDLRNIRIIRNNSVSMYGAVYSQQSFSFLLENLILKENHAVSKGSAYGSTASNVSISNCTFLRNVAGDKGSLYLFEDNNFTCTNCRILSNQAQDSSAVFGINNINGYFFFNSCNFTGNQALSSTATFILSDVTIRNSVFLNNVAQQVNHGITLITSNLWISNMTVNYTLPSFLSDRSDNVDSGFFNVNYQSLLSISNNSVFENCRGALASVVFATGFSSVTLRNKVTIRNSASFSGSTLFFSLTNLAEIHDSSFLNNNQSDLNVQSVNLNISNSLFRGGNNQLIIARMSNLTIRNSTIENGTNYDIQGKGLYCQCDQVLIENSLFQNLRAVEGGAIYLTSSKQSSNFTLRNNTFYLNVAMQGGAVTVNDAGNLNVSGNYFLSNYADLFEDQTTLSTKLVQKGVGGAIKLDCFNENLRLIDNCRYFIGRGNRFFYNHASDDGGAIQWYSNRYQDDGTNNFTGNTAPYAPSSGNYAKEIVFAYINNGDYLNPINNPSPLANIQDSKRNLASFPNQESPKILRIPLDLNERKKRQLQTFTLNGVVSGTPLQFLAYILDQDGNRYRSDNSSLATLKSLTKGIIIQNFEVVAREGVYNFSKFTVNMQPGSSAQFTFSIQNFATYSNNISFIQEFPSITVHSRLCAPGEQYSSDMRCIKCKPGFYLYEAPSAVTTCIACQDQAICYGLNVVAPKPGYWRSSNTSSNFIKCPNSDACLGGSLQNLLGVCADGYTGTACANCIAGFKKSLDFRCSKCPNQATNSVQFIGFLIISTIICIILVRSNILSVEKQRPLHTVYMKMMTNHFQILSAILAIDYNWPSVLHNLQNSQLQLSSFADEIFSFDCFLQSNGFVDESDRIFLQKLIFYTFLPLILGAVSVTVWYAVAFVKRDFKFKDKLIGTVVVLLFLIHTSIAKILFSAFNCLELDGKVKLKDNVEMECYTGRHLVYILAIVIPALVVWIFGIPFVALMIMIKNKTQIQHMHKFHELSKYDQTRIRSIKVRIGFLLHGFTNMKYFWEILIIYRKILIVMVIVLLNASSVEAQVLVVMLILILSVLLHLHYNPYYSEVLNRMELYSLMTACMTMYGGMFYVTGKHYHYMEPLSLGWVFLILILFPNILFLLYWGVHMRVEVLKLLYNNYPRTFRYLTCNYYKDDDFERKYMTENTTNPTQGDLAPRSKLYEERSVRDVSQIGKSPHTNQELVDDFSNILTKGGHNDPTGLSRGKVNYSDARKSSSFSEGDDFNLQRKFENLDFKLKSNPNGALFSSDQEDDTGDSKNKTVSSKDVGIAFPPQMLRRIMQPEDLNIDEIVEARRTQRNEQQRRKQSPRRDQLSGRKANQRTRSTDRREGEKTYNRLTDNSPIATTRIDDMTQRQMNHYVVDDTEGSQRQELSRIHGGSKKSNNKLLTDLIESARVEGLQDKSKRRNGEDKINPKRNYQTSELAFGKNAETIRDQDLSSRVDDFTGRTFQVDPTNRTASQQQLLAEPLSRKRNVRQRDEVDPQTQGKRTEAIQDSLFNSTFKGAESNQLNEKRMEDEKRVRKNGQRVQEDDNDFQKLRDLVGMKEGSKERKIKNSKNEKKGRQVIEQDFEDIQTPEQQSFEMTLNAKARQFRNE